METRRRKIMAAGVAALLLVGLVGCGVAAPAWAQRGAADGDKNNNGNGNGVALGRVGDEVPPGLGLNARVWVVHRGYGFAMADTEFHVLRIHIVRVRHLQPLDMRGLMESGKSIEEIRAELREREGALFYQGYLRLGEDTYRLVNINVTENGAVRNFTADISGPSPVQSATVGTISVTIEEYEGFRVGNGTLTIADATYRVLLQVF
ncbi:MAG: hypothetical protein EFT35_01490 [Methanophagales archaeon ANME-1-THS]|nr:MAG: hypothetical protein EFT35_01490 [Methanophagales archaeon ANME-1-THS]